MNLRRLAAAPLALLVFFTMAIAPFAFARCGHADGDSHLHALGAACGEDGGDTGGRDEKKPADCRAEKAADAKASEAPTPPPPAVIAPSPSPFVILATHLACEDVRIPPALAPPRLHDETNARGATPLLI